MPLFYMGIQYRNMNIIIRLKKKSFFLIAKVSKVRFLTVTDSRVISRTAYLHAKVLGYINDLSHL